MPVLPTEIPPQAPPFYIPTALDGLVAALHRPLNTQPMVENQPDTMPEGAQSAHPFEGGSRTGLDRIAHLIASGSMTRYSKTRNGLLGTDFSTKLSAWLALGCVTARQVHHEMLRFEDGADDGLWGNVLGYGKGQNAGTAAVRFELLWRDYMRLCTRKFGTRLFNVAGFRNDKSYPWTTPNPNDPVASNKLKRFLNGTTGTGLIDASQRELFFTGYTSNRARQNVASYLSKHLGLNWMLGAEWYECMLVDYDVSSNWGNWQYVAGVGNDPRGTSRVFNPVKQASDYDPKGEYITRWVPELRGLSDSQKIFQPWQMSYEEMNQRDLQDSEMIKDPLKQIQFQGTKPRRGGGKYGGSSRGRERSQGRKGSRAGRREMECGVTDQERQDGWVR